MSLKQNNFAIDENKLLAELNQTKLQHGKKIYVGLFKKKDEYFKIKQDKEGKASNLYVKNFGPNFGDRDLFNLFKSFGSIKSAKVRRQKCGLIEKPLGCGFVDFENPEEAENARVSLNGHILHSGRVISVTYADCKSRRMRKKLEENSTSTDSSNTSANTTNTSTPNNLNNSNQISNSNVNNNTSVGFSPTVLSNVNYNKFISNKENEQQISDDIFQKEQSLFSNCCFNINNNSISNNNIYDDYNENRYRSVSTSSETSFDSILIDWSERWNRQPHSEYRLF